MVYTFSYYKSNNRIIEQSAAANIDTNDVREAELRFARWFSERHPGVEALCIIGTQQPTANPEYAETIG